jgi:Ca2+-transporting ATPase
MGRIGTAVAKEAADIVLLDDNFSNIVAAAEEGRSIYQTIKKVILYLFSTSAGEVLIIGLAVLLNWPLPLLAAQIIWLNFVTDGFLDISMAMERKEGGLLEKRFSRPSKYILDRFSLQRLIVMSLLMAAGSLTLFFLYIAIDPIKAQTVSLTVMAAFQWFNAWNCKSEVQSIFSRDFFRNRWLLVSTGLVILLQVLAVYTPFLQNILRTVPLALKDWLVITLVASLIIWPEEIRKLIVRTRMNKSERRAA